MPPAVPKIATPKKKKSPAKEVVKADYAGIMFGGEPQHKEEQEEEPAEDDPLATYRAAAAAAKVAIEKQRQEEIRSALFRKIFAAMDTDGDGKVRLGEMIEVVAAGTAPLSARAAKGPPEASVPLQLPNVFTLAQWEGEMKRVAATMDEATFQANVLGLFDCFTQAKEQAAQQTPRQVLDQASSDIQLSARAYLDKKRAAEKEAAEKAAAEKAAAEKAAAEKEAAKDEAASFVQLSARFFMEKKAELEKEAAEKAAKEKALDEAASVVQMSARLFKDNKLEELRAKKRAFAENPMDRQKELESLFAEMDDGSGSLNVGEMLAQAQKNDELASLGRFLAALSASSAGDEPLSCDRFVSTTLAETPLGQLSDVALDSALRRVRDDVRKVKQREGALDVS